MSHSLVRRPTAIIGAGAVGQALACALASHNVPLTSIISRTEPKAEALARKVGVQHYSATCADVPTATERMLICVPDDEIAAVARAFVPFVKEQPSCIVAHTSGAHPAQVMQPLKEVGAQLLSMHPLQTFTPQTSPQALHGIQITLEGDTKACAYGEALAQHLGARPVRITTEAKPLYHLTAVLASNGLVALLAVAQHIWQEAGLDPSTVFEALQPLVDTTWANVQEQGTAALTGPAARGDTATIETHLHALSHTEQAALHFDVYKALTTVMVRLQQDEVDISRRSATPIETMLQAHDWRQEEQKDAQET